MQVVISASRNSKIVSGAFATGIGVVPMDVDGHMLCIPVHDIAIYGLLRGLLKVWKRAREEGLNWLYLDKGYFRPGHFDGYYSVTWNAFQHTGEGKFERGKERFENLRLDLELKPWRKNGDYILIFPPTEIFSALLGFNPQGWLDDTLRKLKMYSDREIKIRAKPGSMLMGKKIPKGASLEEDVSKAYAVVTYNSKASIKAILEGVPVFTSTLCCTYAPGLSDISQIEFPLYVNDRERWLYALVANQFTLDEMRSGYCAEMLREDKEERRVYNPSADKEIETYFA